VGWKVREVGTTCGGGVLVVGERNLGRGEGGVGMWEWSGEGGDERNRGNRLLRQGGGKVGRRDVGVAGGRRGIGQRGEVSGRVQPGGRYRWGCKETFSNGV